MACRALAAAAQVGVFGEALLEASAQLGALKERYTRRMWDLSEFMKAVKQKFTQWYNNRNGLSGTLWEGRFKSVLVEDGYAARMTAAYIDLNPVRAGMVKDPKDYRWCSYGEACAGGEHAQQGLLEVMLKEEGYAKCKWGQAFYQGNVLNSYDYSCI